MYPTNKCIILCKLFLLIHTRFLIDYRYITVMMLDELRLLCSFSTDACVLLLLLVLIIIIILLVLITYVDL